MLDITQTLKSAKLKVTPARVLILEILGKSDKPLSVEMIGREIKNNTVNQVTIYRTIESLVRVGVIGRVDLRKDAVFYEFLDEHHHHIVCSKCGVLEDFDFCKIDDLSHKILTKSKKFKTILDHSFELFGICNSCARKNA